jgi:manganese/zinc/iron transport system substrate-binding protein
MKQILGDAADVRALMGPGVDPHTYNPRPSDIHWLNEASVIVCNGFHLEGKMGGLFEQLRQRKTVHVLADHVPRQDRILLDEHVVDPHFWFDSRIWLAANQVIAIQVGRQFDLDLEMLNRNFLNWKNALKLVEDRYSKELLRIPKDKRTLITSHDAFHYFGRRFQLEVFAIQGISTAQEPSVRAILDLTDLIVDRKIASIYVENSVNPKTIESLRASCLQKGQVVRIGGALYSDALGTSNSGAATYKEMMEHNLRTVINGLH